MEEKIIESYIYYGLGFPIELKNVLFYKIANEWCPKIDVEQVAHDAILNLKQKEMFSGHELFFIRSYLQLSEKQFADQLNVSKEIISQWEELCESPNQLFPEKMKLVKELLLQF